MKIHISDNQSTEEIKKIFSKHFPNLKIEFFKHNHKQGELSPIEDAIKNSVLLKDIRTKHNEGYISFDGNTTVGELESLFSTVFGINIQVFRKSKGLWIETGATDSWSLNHQEEIAKEMII